MSLIYTPRGRALEYSPRAVNLGTGCLHGCKYCYAPGALRKKKDPFHQEFTPKKDILARLEKDAAKENGSKNRILLSFTHDPYQGANNDTLTMEALKILNRHELNFQILTKGGTRATRDFDLYKPGDAFATSLTFFDSKDSLDIEPRAALPANRIEAIREAKHRGISTWVSFEPVLDAEQVFELYETTKVFVDLYKVGKCSNYKSKVDDWKAFGTEMINRLERDGKSYYIKEDLQKILNT